jgi:hypothetical protein
MRLNTVSAWFQVNPTSPKSASFRHKRRTVPAVELMEGRISLSAFASGLASMARFNPQPDPPTVHSQAAIRYVEDPNQ